MIATLSALVAALGWALLHFLWQGLLVGLAAGLALALLGNARPQARYAVACAALALCLVLPLLTMARHGGDTDLAAASPSVTANTAADAPLLSMDLVATTQGWRQQLQPKLPAIVALWSLGAAALALRMALGLAWVARTGGQGRPDRHWQARLDALATRMALARTVLLRVVDELDGPVAARFWRPVVLVPAALIARMPTDLLEALLAHELAHVRRHDYLVNLVQSAIEALLFYHPVVWWLSRRIRIEREQIADDLAAQALGEPRRLALALNELAQFRAPPPHLAPAAHGGLLMSRIQRLVRPRKHAPGWKLALPFLGLSAACLSVFAQGTGVTAAEVAHTQHSTSTVHRVDGGDTGHFAIVGQDNEARIVSASRRELSDIEALRGRIGGEFLWFSRDGRAYVIQDPALIARARAAWQPTEALGAQMEALGDEMKGHGDRMEAIGARMEAHAHAGDPAAKEMEKLGAQMEALGTQMEPLAAQMEGAAGEAQRQRLSSRMDELSAQMQALGAQMDTHATALAAAHAPLEKLGAEMEVAGRPMRALGKQMEGLGEEMDRLSTRANRDTLGVIDQAMRDGKALPVESAARR